MRHGRMRCARGQASIEWIAVVGVVTTALVVAGAAAGAPSIAGVVVRQFRRALCIVSHGDCNEDRLPCVTTSDTDTEADSVNLLLVRVSSTTQLLIERRSDGTWRVTRTHDLGAGPDVGIGGDFSISGLGLKLAVGGEARASVLAHVGHGATWLAHSRAEAQWLAIELSLGRHPPGQPVQHYSQHGTQVSLQGSVTVPEGALGVQLTQDDITGTRTDTTTGATTTYLRQRLDLDGALQFGEGLAGVSLHGTKSTDYAVTTDRTGRPVDFEIISVGQLTGGVGLPGITQHAPAALLARAAKGRAWESEQHLDLTDPDNLAAVTAFMKGLNHPSDGIGRFVVAARGLAARLAIDGTDQLRVYRMHQDSEGVSGHLAVGLKIGGSYRQTSTDMKLVDADVRGPDGIWTTRDDCVSAA